jgi:aminobenzoyl-glutamate utilization protein B
VQARARVLQLVRARTNGELLPLVDRVRDIARGAALMTGTTVTEKVRSAVSNLLPCPPLERLMEAHLLRLGAPPFDAADVPFAVAIRATLTDADIAATWKRTGRPMDRAKPLADFVVTMDQAPRAAQGSTDVGDVTWAVPTVQAWVATCAIGTPFHSWQLTAQGKSGPAHKGMIHAAKAMAAVGRDLIADPRLLADAKADHAARLAVEPYVCPMPPEVMPPIPA